MRDFANPAHKSETAIDGKPNLTRMPVPSRHRFGSDEPPGAGLPMMNA